MTSSATALEATSTPSPTTAAMESTPIPAQAVLINEIAWAGTWASSNDEWIELHNPAAYPVDLSGWRLTDGGDIDITLQGAISPFGYFVLERTDDSTIGNLVAHQIYRGALSNAGEILELLGPSGERVDSANQGGGSWPAGDSESRSSMERSGGADLPGNWGTYTGPGGAAVDASGALIRGTPGAANSLFLPTQTPTATPLPFPLRSVLINEIAWSGTRANPSDEWIELHNPSASAISLAGWKLTDGGDIQVDLTGSLSPYGYHLLERSDDRAVTDVAADQTYTGGLNDQGETLRLFGPQGELVDSADGSGGWPAGSAATRDSMERRGGGDSPGSWASFTGHHGVGHDVAGNPIRGTPRSINSLSFPTPVPTWIPGRVVINEVLIRPRHDWEGTGGVSTADEFIELYNHGPGEVYLRGWWLDDVAGAGSKPSDLPGLTIPAKGYAVFFRSFTGVALNDDGDSVRLLAPDGRLIDQVSYLPVRAYNLSFGRLPDGSRRLTYGLWPTPGEANLLFEEPIPPIPPGPFYPGACPAGSWPAGGKVVRASMERRGLIDNPGSWAAFAGNHGRGRDAQGNPIPGTAGASNWALGASGRLPLPAQDGRTLSSTDRPAPGSAYPLSQPPLILINEVAWAGTRASANDEWIELHNPGSAAVDLAGWTLTDQNDINVELGGVLRPGQFLLLERGDDTTVSDVPANLIYTGRLENAGETLWLRNEEGLTVDSANAVGPGVPHPMLVRAARGPAQLAWLRALGMMTCK